MPRKGQRIKHRKPAAIKPKGQAAGNPADHPLAHHRLTRYMEEHFEWMRVTGYSADTVRSRRQAIRRFIAWADKQIRGRVKLLIQPDPLFDAITQTLEKTDGTTQTTAPDGSVSTVLK